MSDYGNYGITDFCTKYTFCFENDNDVTNFVAYQTDGYRVKFEVRKSCGFVKYFGKRLFYGRLRNGIDVDEFTRNTEDSVDGVIYLDVRKFYLVDLSTSSE